MERKGKTLNINTKYESQTFHIVTLEAYCNILHNDRLVQGVLEVTAWQDHQHDMFGEKQKYNPAVTSLDTLPSWTAP